MILREGEREGTGCVNLPTSLSQEYGNPMVIVNFFTSVGSQLLYSMVYDFRSQTQVGHPHEMSVKNTFLSFIQKKWLLSGTILKVGLIAKTVGLVLYLASSLLFSVSSSRKVD